MGSGRKQGFTLIEVVIALAVLGIGLVILIELFAGGLRLGRTSGEYTKAVGYARMKLEEVALAERIVEGAESGNFDREYRWEVAIKKVDLLPLAKAPDFIPPVEFYQVRVFVIWKSGSRERTTVVESYRTVKVPPKGEEVARKS